MTLPYFYGNVTIITTTTIIVCTGDPTVSSRTSHRGNFDASFTSPDISLHQKYIAWHFIACSFRCEVKSSRWFSYCGKYIASYKILMGVLCFFFLFFFCYFVITLLILSLFVCDTIYHYYLLQHKFRGNFLLLYIFDWDKHNTKTCTNLMSIKI